MFKVILLNLNYKFDENKNIRINVPKNVSKNVPKNEYEQIIIAAIKNNNTITRKELAFLIGKTIKTVQRIIDKSDKIKHVGPKKVVTGK